MDDIKNMIAAADLASTEGKRPSNASLAELFRALRKSKVRYYHGLVKSIMFDAETSIIFYMKHFI